MKRTSRRGSSAHTPVVSTPPPSTSSRPQRPPSPLSPTKMSRMDEKMEMQHLNDRFAQYIEKIRQQRQEIDFLKHEKHTVEESKTVEVRKVTKSYENELNKIRAALDDTAKERARFQIDAEKYEKEAKELRAKLREKERQYDTVNKDNKTLQTKVNNLQNRNDQQQDDLNNANRDLNDLKAENARLQKKLEDAKRNLESETLQRVEFQNNLQTTQEKMAFDGQVLEQQLEETKTRRQIEISELDGRYQEEYDAKLHEKLQELRHSFDDTLANNRKDLANTFEQKIKDLQSKYEKERVRNSGSSTEIRELQTKVNGLTSRNVELENVNVAISRRIKDLEEELDSCRMIHRSDMAKIEELLAAKEEELAQLLKDYQDLSEIKIKLDMEIQTYNKLLSGEEERLGISQSDTPEVSSSKRGLKRKRTIQYEEEIDEYVSEHDGKGNLVIEPVEVGAKSITVKNISDDDLNIGQWTLACVSGGEECKYRFHRTVNMKSGESCTVWSSDCDDVTHEPPLTLVMKKGGWTLDGDENLVTLTGKDGEEEANRVSKKEHRVSGSKRFGSVLYGQSGEEDSKNCVIM